jgi:hypothetical protein
LKDKNMRRISVSTVVSIGIIVVAIAPAYGEPASSFILRAFEAEEHTAKKRADLSFRSGENDMRYVIERILPDKLHMQMKDRNHEEELYVIGDRLYVKGPLKWTTTRAVPQLAKPLSVVGLFRSALENVTEQVPVTAHGVEQRVFTGKIAWFSGYNINAGELRIFIERTSALPRLMTFKGTCGSSACSFEHAITYDPALQIEAPVQ